MQAIQRAHRMISHSKRHTFGHHARGVILATLGFVMLCAIALPAQAASRTAPPWHIESFCHRGVPSARRCLVRARQGIIVFQLVELTSAPAVRWSDGMAVLTSGADDGSRQLRFFVPPQKLSAPFKQVHAYDIQQQLVALYADGRVHLRAMFADDHDLAVLALPADIGMATLQLRFEGRSLHASWCDSQGRAQEQTLHTKN